MENAAGVAGSAHGVSLPMNCQASRKEGCAVSEQYVRNPSYEVQQGREPADVDCCAVTTDRNLDNDILAQRLYSLVKQREELQRMEISLRAEISEVQIAYDSLLKDHSNTNAKLQVQQGREPADVDCCAVTTDRNLDNDILAQRLHSLVKQREELQQMEISLRAEIIEIQIAYDSLLKDHSNTNAKLQYMNTLAYLTSEAFSSIPLDLVMDLQKMLSTNQASRPTALDFTGSRFLRDDTGLHALRFLVHMLERENIQKSEFLKALSDMWKDFDSRVSHLKASLDHLICHVPPMLVRACDDSDARLQEEVFKKTASLTKQLDVQLVKQDSLPRAHGLALKTTVAAGSHKYSSETSLVALKSRNFVVIGADSRTCLYYNMEVHSEETMKLDYICPYVFVARSGAQNTSLPLIQKLRERYSCKDHLSTPVSVKQVAESIGKFAPPIDAFNKFIVGGQVPPKGPKGSSMPVIELLEVVRPSGGFYVTTRTEEAYGGSGGSLCKKVPLNIINLNAATEDEVRNVIKEKIQAARKRDWATDGKLNTVTVCRILDRPHDPDISYHSASLRTGGKPSTPYEPYIENVAYPNGDPPIKPNGNSPKRQKT